MPNERVLIFDAALPTSSPVGSFLETAVGAVNYGAAIFSTALVFYIGAAVGVALFHPDQKRRSDARTVLNSILSMLRRRRK